MEYSGQFSEGQVQAQGQNSCGPHRLDRLSQQLVKEQETHPGFSFPLAYQLVHRDHSQRLVNFIRILKLRERKRKHLCS